MNTDEEIRAAVHEALEQAKFDHAMDLERLRQCMDAICKATGEHDWEGATSEIISRSSRLSTCEKELAEEREYGDRQYKASLAHMNHAMANGAMANELESRLDQVRLVVATLDMPGRSIQGLALAERIRTIVGEKWIAESNPGSGDDLHDAHNAARAVLGNVVEIHAHNYDDDGRCSCGVHALD